MYDRGAAVETASFRNRYSGLLTLTL